MVLMLSQGYFFETPTGDPRGESASSPEAHLRSYSNKLAAAYFPCQTAFFIGLKNYAHLF